MAQRMVAEGSDEMALILEDDLRIHDDLPEVLDRLERGTAGKFDVIRLHRYKLKRKYVPVRDIGANRTIGFVRPADSGTQAYVVSREAALGVFASVPGALTRREQLMSSRGSCIGYKGGRAGREAVHTLV